MHTTLYTLSFLVKRPLRPLPAQYLFYREKTEAKHVDIHADWVHSGSQWHSCNLNPEQSVQSLNFRVLYPSAHHWRWVWWMKEWLEWLIITSALFWSQELSGCHSSDRQIESSPLNRWVHGGWDINLSQSQVSAELDLEPRFSWKRQKKETTSVTQRPTWVFSRCPQGTRSTKTQLQSDSLKNHSSEMMRMTG